MKKINHDSKMKGYLSVILVSVLCLAGCGQDEKLGLDPVDSVAPGIPTNISVENRNGEAIISYTAPKDDDLLCVVATYMINGNEMRSKASPYVHKLKVEGFGEEGEYQITLKSVDTSKNESDPVIVTVHPTTPPVKAIFNSLKVAETFGGVRLTWDNPTEANIIIEVSQQEGDEWVSVENFYSSTTEGTGTIRGYKPELVTFRFRIRDRWDNYSEFLVGEYLPVEEYEIDKKKFKALDTNLPGDAVPHSSLGIAGIWDGSNASRNCFHTSGDGVDRAVTFDMGQMAKISRFKMYERSEQADWIYGHNNLKHYIVYACNEITPDMYKGGQAIEGVVYPTFTGWTKVLDTWCYKPSGDSGTVTNEDKEYIAGGDEHEISADVAPFRYVRILMLETWSGGVDCQIGEMTFYGKTVEESFK